MIIKKVMGFTILFVMLAASLSVTAIDIHQRLLFTNDLVRIDLTEGSVILPKDIEIIGGNPGQWIDIILPHTRLQELSNADIPYSLLIHDVEQYSQGFRGQYYTLAQIEQNLQTIAASYPQITSLYSIGTTYQGRDIWCLEITDNPGVDEGEPGVFFMGLHHAREWPTVNICLHIANQLTSLYSSNSTIQNIVNNRRIWIVPCVNPDGYYYSHDVGVDWRKNRQYFPQFNTYGVDLNRNYGGSCDGNPVGAWGSIGGATVTHNPGQEIYCGPQAMSELETQAIRNVFINNDICATISWHTYSELVLWPWGYSGTQQTPDNAYLAQVGQQIASRITKQSGSGTYTPQQSAGLYPTTGDTTDWAYGYAHYVQGRTTFAYTIEACAVFQPPAGALDQIVAENFDGALYLLQEAETIKNTVIPRVLPPQIDVMTTDADGNYRVSWQQQNTAANPDFFHLDELSGLTIVTDDAEAGSTLWNLNGFTQSTNRYYSGSKSYKSRSSNSDVSSMTSVFPTPVTQETILSFWCWYDIELNYDYAFVEISCDGRHYEVLDTFTGSSAGWINKDYNLHEHANKSVFIRFRFTTDQNTLKEGFYVDDISSVTTVETVTTLSSSISNKFYDISGKENGTYYYRVKGHNNARGWGDFSTLQSIEVVLGSINDTTPPVVLITTPKEKHLYFRNKESVPFFATVIIGGITIEVNATDDVEIDRVDFLINDKFVGNDSTEPFTYNWTTLAFFRQTITAIAYDTAGNHAEKKITVWKFF